MAAINRFLDYASDGPNFSFHRLAEDMLSYLCTEFRVQRRLIPLPRCAENDYPTEDTIGFLCRICKLDQIVHRRSFNVLFTRNNEALRCVNDGSKLKAFVAGCIDSVRDGIRAKGHTCGPQELFHLSFACVMELSLFYISRGHSKALKKMAAAWLAYFDANIGGTPDFEGPVLRLLERTVKAMLLEHYFEEFIPLHCVPYTGEDVYGKFLGSLPEKAREGAAALRSAWMLTDDLVPFLLAESEYDPAPLEVHDRLGLVPHEELLKRELRSSTEADAAAAAPPPSDRDAAAIAALTLASERKKAKKAGMGRRGKPRVAEADSAVPSTSRVADSPEVDPDPEPRTPTPPTPSEKGARPKERKTRKR